MDTEIGHEEDDVVGGEGSCEIVIGASECC